MLLAEPSFRNLIWCKVVKIKSESVGINQHIVMKKLTIDIPDSFNLDDKEIKMALASKLYERDKLSLGQAATLAGYSKETFMELLADYGVSLINYPTDQIHEDIKNAQNYSS